MTLATAQPLCAGTFTKSAIAPELGLDALTREVARAQVGRDLFANPYATVTIGHTDIYDRFPYLESRQFQVVSDPRWNRLIVGERGHGLSAFDGRGGATGALREPRGLAVDENDRVYVADTGNDRIVVLQASTELDAMTLSPLYEIRGLSRPFDVAVSDGGTPFRAGDDVLYVTDTGRNRLVAYALEAGAPRLVATLGDLGSGQDRFAGPMAITVGRANSGNTGDVYVADAHNRRLVHLRHEGSSLRWVGEAPVGADVVTSLETDQWGNLYASAPNQGVVRKFNAELSAVAELRDGLSRPRAFHVPFSTVRDHRDGRVERVGEPTAISIDEWASGAGLRMWSLGVELNDLRVDGEGAPVAHFALTDHANVSFEIADAATGRMLVRRNAGAMEAGVHTLALTPEDLQAAGGNGQFVLRMSAASGYSGGATANAQTPLQLDGAASLLPMRASLLGSAPNPAAPVTRIAFLLPANGREHVSLRIFDAQGRRVRGFDRGFVAGLNQIAWDGTDEGGRPVRAGVYLYQLQVGGEKFTQRLVLVR
ncbi:MAG: T9SS type A sorting domain-containing protein [Candidatus Eisenbacteria bacterium]|uniref:T9SS type A sorting domain-containing protein n=1 Tax=Eiseniibacteriota bacterium TaxID=2212470 RepID=A0A849SSD0_UNCEI|nr:T9SS type A sorting domain-containing protein [Candidatus Eisenbacteria bacterium]